MYVLAEQVFALYDLVEAALALRGLGHLFEFIGIQQALEAVKSDDVLEALTQDQSVLFCVRSQGVLAVVVSEEVPDSFHTGPLEDV